MTLYTSEADALPASEAKSDGCVVTAGSLKLLARPRPKRRYLRLMIVTTSAPYKLAYSCYAIGAYNINNLEQTLFEVLTRR